MNMKHGIGLVAVLGGVFVIGPAYADPVVEVVAKLPHAQAVIPPGGNGGGGKGGGGTPGNSGSGDFDLSASTFRLDFDEAPDPSFDGGQNGFAANQATAAQMAKLAAQNEAKRLAGLKRLNGVVSASVRGVESNGNLAHVPTPGASVPSGSQYAEAGRSSGPVNNVLGVFGGASVVVNPAPVGSPVLAGDSQMAGNSPEAPKGEPATQFIKNSK